MDPITLTLISTVIQTLVLPVIALLLKRWTDSIKQEDTRKALNFALERLNATAQTVVLELNQTSKQLGADGKLSKADASVLLNTAYTNLSTRIPADVLATLQAVYGDKLPAVMTSKIEATVGAAKTCG